MRRAVFLDRDGVINADHGYVHTREEFQFLPGVKDACRAFTEAGLPIVIVTNQSGIGRGYFTENDFHALTEWMKGEFLKAGAVITAVYFCPHHPEAAVERYRKACGCRKPAPGMILEAARDLGLDLRRSVIFGDSPRDIEAGAAAGVGTRVLLGKNGLSVPAPSEHSTHVFRSLAEAASNPWFQRFTGVHNELPTSGS